MMTGDNRVTAQAVARELGIDDVEADVLPGANEVVTRLRSEVVCVAGDGVNDAPALASADGYAMGGGTDVAMESAGVTLLHGDLRGIVAPGSSLATCAISQNRSSPCLQRGRSADAAGVLYHSWSVASPALAALAMALSSGSVIANALRLSRQNCGLGELA